ncbi:uncharacterized protein PRCAT00002302001 [Priceomyces carsonii]|uniref:uncharacterized protein n=1 Tax=Priceomyces carsonii TaxID=28549 RepID=UPI002ED85611|nr:unnamed protein product [Priceomyces carsonii]
MVVTRSNLNTQSSPKKIKFSEDDFEENETHINTIAVSKDPESDVISEDSDEAPEEESTTTTREQVIAKQKEESQRQTELKQLEKEKRRKRDEQYRQQQEEKKKKEQEKSEALPQFLPDDVFETLNDSIASDQERKMHLTLSDFEKLDQKLLNSQLKEEKLRKIRNSKKQSIKKGPVNVAVHSFNTSGKIKVPPAESKVTNSKNKWLKRKALNKK